MKDKKIPGIFKRKLKEKKWKKKIIRNIHIPSDRQMVENLYEPRDGRMVLNPEIPDEIIKKLKPLSKAIKKNKGMVTRWKAFILLAVAGSILIFTFFFKNKVLETVIESSLEKVFQAQVDVVNPRFSLFKGEFGFESLTIQDKKEPGRNLIETGSSNLSISIPELTRNRFRIKKMILEDVQLNTSRESDTLDVKHEDSGSSKPSLLDLSSLKDLTDDPTTRIESLIEEQKENLQTFKMIEGASKDLDEFTTRWKKTFGDSQNEISQLTKKYSGIANQGIPSITSIDDGKALVKKYEGYYKEISAEKDRVINLQNQFQNEKDRILNYRNNIEDVIGKDLEYLSGLITLPQQKEMQNFVSDKIKEILQKRFNAYYTKAMKLMPLYEKFKDQEKKKEEKKVSLRYPGRFILYPSPDRPRFLIEEARLSGGDDNSGFFNLGITGITSEPEKWSEPVKLDSQWKKNGTSMTLDGILNLKDQAPELFNIQFESPENPVSWKEGIPVLGIDSAKAELSYKGTGLSRLETKGVTVNLDLDFSDIEIKTSGKDDILSQTVTDTLNRIKDFMVTATVQITKEGIQSVKVDSEIDKILKQRLGDLIKDLPQQGADKLETYLRKMISERMLGIDGVKNTLNALNLESLDQIRSMEDLQSAVKKLEDQAQGQAAALVKGLQDKAEAEAERIKAEAAAEAERIKAEAAAEAARKKAEAEAQAKKEAERIKKEAEEKARLEAEKLKSQNPIKIPGF